MTKREPKPNASAATNAQTESATAGAASDAGTAGASAHPAAASPAPLRDFQITPGRVTLRGHANVDWAAVLPCDVRPEDLHMRLEPYASIAGMLTRGDSICAVTEDDKRLFELRVVFGDRGRFAMCAVVNVFDLPDLAHQLEDVLPNGFDIRAANSGDREQGFPPGSFVAYRKLDGAVMIHDHFFKREDCRQALLNHAAVRVPGTRDTSVARY